MAETGVQNWKEKYLSALEEFETSHKKDQQRLDLLRRGLVRVSLAADGLDKTLDHQLDELRSGLRGSRDINSLEPLVSQLERTIISLDDRRKDNHGELESLLDSQLEQCLPLDLPRQVKSDVKKLRKELPDLLANGGASLDLWKRFQQVQEQVRQHLVVRIDDLSANRGSFLSRLFSGQQRPATDPAPEVMVGDRHVEPTRYTPAQAQEFQLEEPGQTDAVPREDESDADPHLLERLSRLLCNLLSQLEVPVEYSVRKEKLVDRIKSPFTLEHLPEFIDETTQLVASTRLTAQKEFESFLVALHQRLLDIQEFLVTAKQGEEKSLRNQEKLDADVRQELKEMRVSVAGTEDMGRLREEIEGMVNRIVAAVDSFHEEEKNRRDEVFGRIETLAKRMESMEAEASELKSSLEAQRMEALRDALTELPNRAAYDEQIEREFSRWRRHGRPLSICVVDIDHFKSINDSMGHLRGDKVLKLVAREVSRRVRSEDFVARYGGEEFIIIMPETDLQSAVAAAEKVRLAVAECPFNFNNERIPVTASFGVATFQDKDEIESCFERADKALYRAKAAGRNRVERG
ncbi:MAG: GGDEF domain-containing protein [Gammaproteobacteria bacterium]|nr:GGDEF domain-containing protein [Gammaproteobacteria bacterium]